jgi:hypothetical protein
LEVAAVAVVNIVVTLPVLADRVADCFIFRLMKLFVQAQLNQAVEMVVMEIILTAPEVELRVVQCC